MGRRLNWRRIKVHYSYTIEEAARLLGVHKHTVRLWSRAGLPIIGTRRPYLIQGLALRDFLATRQRRRRQRCRPGEIYCLPCRAPKSPAGLMAEYMPLTVERGNLRGICPDCERLIHRVVALSKVESVRGNLEVTFPQAVQRIRQGTLPSDNCYLRRVG